MPKAVQSITTKYGLGVRVAIKGERGFRVTITRFMIAADGIQYEASWMHDGQRKTDWFYEHELEGPSKQQIKVGFGDEK